MCFLNNGKRNAPLKIMFSAAQVAQYFFQRLNGALNKVRVQMAL